MSFARIRSLLNGGPKSAGLYRLAFGVCLLLLLGVRFVGLTRGAVDFVPADSAPPGDAFYHFHPDEKTVIETALQNYDPLAPASTAYGPLNSHLLGATLAAAQLGGWGADGLRTTESTRQIYWLTRALATIYGLLSVLLTYTVGRYLLPMPFAAGAAFVLGLAPLSIQQGHFYTPDGLFTLMALGFFWALFAALRHGGNGRYLVCGAMVGLAAATRINGVMLCGLVGVALLLQAKGEIGPRLLQVLRRPPLWTTAGSALLVLCILQPHLLVDPFQSDSTDFSLALQVARGQILAPWSLADAHTPPYLHYWSSLLPQAVGWPLTVLFAAASAFAFWRPPSQRLLLGLWCLAAFAVVGGLHTKHVRYLMPLLPFFCLLAADLARHLWQSKGRIQSVLRWLPLACALYGLLYGLAFSRVYHQEDSRIRAARWIETHIPPGSAVGLERGGFSMSGLISHTRYRTQDLGISRLFYTAPYLLCSLRHESLRQYFRDQEFFVALDINRHRQFSAVPELFPAAAAAYRNLFAGDLGFAEIARFETTPVLGPLRWDRTGAEPSFVGYDHPTVHVFRRQSPEAVDRAFALTSTQLATGACADKALRLAATALAGGEAKNAALLAQACADRFPYDRLAPLIGAEALQQLGDIAAAEATLTRSQPTNDGPLAHLANPAMTYLIPYVAGRSMFELGLEELALRLLFHGAQDRPKNEAMARDLAINYTTMGHIMLRRDRPLAAEKTLRYAADLSPTTSLFTALGGLAHQRGDAEQAANDWYASLRMNPDQTDVYHQLARLLSQGDPQIFLDQIKHQQPSIAARLAAAVAKQRGD